MNTLTLSEIWIYPVKSLGGIPLETSRFNGKGLLYDRRWMLIDTQGVFLTQRIYPEMALFKVGIDEEKLTISFQKDKIHQPSVSFPINFSVTGESLKARIWNDEVLVKEVDPAISRWFSERLGIRCKLVSFPEENPRAVEESCQINKEQVSLADAFPFLIIGQSSLDDLNRKLKDAVPMNRFRPNFVFKGGDPYTEDDWKNFTIGNNKFLAVKKCARCTIPNVNQATAAKSQEPLRTLAGYRTINHKTFFGQNLIALQEGELAVGDLIIPG